MNPGLLLAVALLCGAAVAAWPGRARLGLGQLALRPPDDNADHEPASGLRALWHDDPVEVARRWRRRRRPVAVEAGVLALLDAVAPALQAGLTPSAAIEVALEGGGRPGAGELRRFLDRLESVCAQGLPATDAWRELAARSGSQPVAFVAAAWGLSEATGAPLAVAVERAAESLRDAASRRRRVAVAVAGPRATVLVLTVLPLTGPLFGLAAGVPPVELYVGSPLALTSAVVGSVLVLLGRAWCRRMIRSAVAP